VTGARRQPSSAPDRAAPRGPRPTVWPRLLQTLRASGSSGWWPAAILAIATAMVLVAFGTSIADVTIFGLYVAFGIALPGMLWVRFLRGHPTHIAEDLMLGLALGYCLEIAGYVVARAIGAPLVFLAWPVLTLAGFAAIPALRRH
jgi:hypothetical protein